MKAAEILLAKVLRDPASMANLAPDQWELLVRQGRHTSLLPRLGSIVQKHLLEHKVPQAPLQHLLSAMILAGKQHRSLAWEVGQIAQCLDNSGIGFILLKGGAYVGAGLEASAGRLFTDIDIMVDESDIAKAEKALLYKGWVTADPDPYDQRYYRQWMHEIPPLRHMLRKTVLDLHHNILPRTARHSPDAKLLIANAVNCNATTTAQVLCPADMVLHSATHLFYDGDFDHGLRDLSDLDLLMKEFSRAPGFWTVLVERARQLDLCRPLYYALKNCVDVLETPVPKNVLVESSEFGPARVLRPVMDGIMSRGLTPNHPSCNDGLSALIRGFLYVRGHWLRMPLHLLIPHLARKVWQAVLPVDDPA